MSSTAVSSASVWDWTASTIPFFPFYGGAKIGNQHVCLKGRCPDPAAADHVDEMRRREMAPPEQFGAHDLAPFWAPHGRSSCQQFPVAQRNVNSMALTHGFVGEELAAEFEEEGIRSQAVPLAALVESLGVQRRRRSIHPLDLLVQLRVGPISFFAVDAPEHLVLHKHH